MPLFRVSFLIGYLLTIILFARAQDSVKLAEGIRLPFDTLVGKQILHSLNQFINQKEFTNLDNQYVLPEDLLYTSALLDELKKMETNAKGKTPAFFAAYINNLVALADSSFLIQLSYLGVKNDTPVLKALFNLIVKRGPDHYYFSSPLVKNTVFWRTVTLGNTTFHYKRQLDFVQARKYTFYDSVYNEKLNIENQRTQFYIAENFPEALQLLGVPFKMAYTGYGYNSLTSFEKGVLFRISGTPKIAVPDFDPHDMWHEKLRTVINPGVINRPVDEGCAYLYGGSWGLSWNEILTAFKIYAKTHSDANWLELYKNGSQFVIGRYPNSISDVINALIIQKFEKETGFGPVILLIQSGPREKGDLNYFTTLQKVYGITQTDFNNVVWDLIGYKK